MKFMVTFLMGFILFGVLPNTPPSHAAPHVTGQAVGMSTTSMIDKNCGDIIADINVYKQYWDEEEQRCRKCSECNQGWGLNKNCGNGKGKGAECVECGSETFSSSFGYDRCEPCAICDNVQYNLQECTRTTDRICGPCLKGFFKDAFENCESCDNFPPGIHSDCDFTTAQTTTDVQTTETPTIKMITDAMTEAHQMIDHTAKHHDILNTEDAQFTIKTHVPKYSQGGDEPKGKNLEERPEVGASTPVQSNMHTVWPVVVIVLFAGGVIVIVTTFMYLLYLIKNKYGTVRQAINTVSGSKSITFDNDTDDGKPSNCIQKDEETGNVKVDCEKNIATYTVTLQDQNEAINLQAGNPGLQTKNSRNTSEDKNKANQTDQSTSISKIHATEKGCDRDGEDQAKKRRKSPKYLNLCVPAFKRSISRESAHDSDEEQHLLEEIHNDGDDVFDEQRGEINIPSETSVLLSTFKGKDSAGVQLCVETKNTVNTSNSSRGASSDCIIYAEEERRVEEAQQREEWQLKFKRALALSKGKPITDLLNDETTKYDIVSLLTPPPPDSTSQTKTTRYYSDMLSGIGVEYKHRNRFKKPDDVLEYMSKSMEGNRDIKRILTEVHNIKRLDITDYLIDFVSKKYEQQSHCSKSS
ncbi:uncharacterized protein LOC144438589 [Glandiceps talaboti]